MPSASASRPVAPAPHAPQPAAVPEPTFGLPMPKRQKTGNGVRDGQSTSSSSRTQATGIELSRAPASSSRTVNGGLAAIVRRTGTTLAEAIAIDDDDESQGNGGPASAAIASAPAPSSARAPASSSSQILPECDTCTSRDHASDSCLMLRATPVQIGRYARSTSLHSIWRETDVLVFLPESLRHTQSEPHCSNYTTRRSPIPYAQCVAMLVNWVSGNAQN